MGKRAKKNNGTYWKRAKCKEVNRAEAAGHAAGTESKKKARYRNVSRRNCANNSRSAAPHPKGEVQKRAAAETVTSSSSRKRAREDDSDDDADDNSDNNSDDDSDNNSDNNDSDNDGSDNDSDESPSSSASASSDDSSNASSGNSSVQLFPYKIQTTYTQYLGHWLDDADVLLQVGNTRFKVHKSRLVAESVWFKALFDGRADGSSEYLSRVQLVLANKEVVGGLDLFLLSHSGNDAPSASQFATLLTALEFGISQYLDTPTIQDVQNIFEAGKYFMFERYRKFGELSFDRFFPAAIPTKDSFAIPPEYITKGLELGHRFVELEAILRPIYYYLAQLPASVCGDGDGLPVGVVLTKRHLRHLLHVQKRLSFAWDKAGKIFDHSRCVHRGKKRERCCFQGRLDLFLRLKILYPFNPILGLQEWKNNQNLVKLYCKEDTAVIGNLIEQKVELIWANMLQWIKEVDTALE